MPDLLHRRMCVSGTVQGVGFRPFVYRTALSLGLTGYVRNSAEGVEILVQGTSDALDVFSGIITKNPPPLAVISAYTSQECPPVPVYDGFRIMQSGRGEVVQVDVARDTAPCSACVRELKDPDNRRYRHPFINCTDCGPRYTIIRSMPYDRCATTMAQFDMCEKCALEYRDPANRRFHAQPVCCPSCGPRLSLHDTHGNIMDTNDPVRLTADLLRDEKIIAIKGIGGFHLACRADSYMSIERLRTRKHREERPLAVMVADVMAAAGIVWLSPLEKTVLESPERPILIAGRRDGIDAIAANVAPGMNTLGVMLPYSPLHHLLFEAADYPALVMTSANVSGEPLCIDNDEAVLRLRGIADAFLMHDRPIHVRTDDSIIRVLNGAPVLLRRGRGLVPAPLPVPADATGIVALGGIMKSTVAIGRGHSCYVSQYLGTADTMPVVENGAFVMRHLQGVLDVQPTMFAADMHPGGLTASLATGGVPLMRIQHHFAHAVACISENAIQQKTVCMVFDGMGMGDDGTIWGGEILLAGCDGYERIAHVSPMPMPGGDAAVIHPGRMALGIIYTYAPQHIDTSYRFMSAGERDAVIAMLKAGINCPITTSAGRLFDALAAVLNICRKAGYEGQPAMMLEGEAAVGDTGAYGYYDYHNSNTVIDSAGIFVKALEDTLCGTAAGIVSAKFHATLARAAAQTACEAATRRGIDTIALSGGCFQNELLLRHTMYFLKESGMNPVVHRLLPPGDECISYGQTVIAARARSKGVL